MALLRTISGRVRSFRAIQNAVTHHGQRVAQKLDAKYNTLLPDALKMDFWALMQAVFTLLRHSCDRLTETEHRLVGERGNDSAPRQQRDGDFAALRSAMLGLRNAFVSVYDPADLAAFGFPAVLGRIPFDLIRQADFLVETLSRRDLVLPEPKYTGGLDLSKEIGVIRVATAALRQSFESAEAEVKLAQAAKVDKDRAQDEWDVLFLWGGRIITGLFFWAGEPELADYIQPSSRRPGRTRRIADQDAGTADVDGAADIDDTEPADPPPVDDSTPGEDPAPDEDPDDDGETPPLDDALEDPPPVDSAG